MSEAFTFFALMTTVASGTALLTVSDTIGEDNPTRNSGTSMILAAEDRPYGSSHGIFVEAEVNGNKLTFLVDTGATLTILSADDAKMLGVSGNDTRFVKGVGGSVEAKIAKVDLKVQGQVIADMDVAVVNGVPHSLLGLDAMHKLGTPQLIFR
jgi:clan AA aspartic protease (TIGR02281 family)